MQVGKGRSNEEWEGVFTYFYERYVRLHVATRAT